MVAEGDALPGRTDRTIPVPDAHFVNGNPRHGPWPDGFETAVVGMGTGVSPPPSPPEGDMLSTIWTGRCERKRVAAHPRIGILWSSRTAI